jgi:hypothetical protein
MQVAFFLRPKMAMDATFGAVNKVSQFANAFFSTLFDFSENGYTGCSYFLGF